MLRIIVIYVLPIYCDIKYFLIIFVFGTVVVNIFFVLFSQNSVLQTNNENVYYWSDSNLSLCAQQRQGNSCNSNEEANTEVLVNEKHKNICYFKKNNLSNLKYILNGHHLKLSWLENFRALKPSKLAKGIQDPKIIRSGEF